MAYSPTLLDAVAVLVAVILFNRLFAKKRQGPLPPGPKGLPLIGNMLDMPASHEWRTFAQWGERWGDIVSVTFLGQPYIILNSAKHALDMLEKKSSIYSSRPIIPVGGELVGWNRTLALLPYGNKFREYRRLIFQLIGSKKNMERFIPLVEEKTRDFVVEVYQQPTELLKHVRKSAGAIILTMSHGYEVQAENDPFVATVDEAMEQFAICTSPAGFLANIFPALAHIPAWVPGAGFRKVAAAWRRTLDEMCDKPHDFVKQRMANGTDIPNFTSVNLEGDITPEREELVKNAASSLYAGGADTTVSAINTFYLAMTLNPEVQKKAQAEIEAVIGTDRLPTTEDRENLPYVNAVLLEVLRWNNVAPLAIPHRVIEDDFHAGYFIPKDSIVIANVWRMLHDPETYADPMSFNPDRFLAAPGKEPETDPRGMVFGFGRRICPGLQLADSSVFLAVAMSLAVFKIEKPVENGEVVEPSTEYTAGTVSHPPPYKCEIKPRSAKAEALLHSLIEHKNN
ncbi:cytochrome P450 [Trametes versicolor FP-101664 SS1]|uniref:cytochrome P450 n=1 Tax=Trametes versicolor (strain FP-101664) TaxID=717944 RepID=UPI0004624395|nr:cytochrome P450 [Trametes versicolor FP-101664 SS1]EIW61897.1 cytochrome P450 [Trametes versicolor FP-101664 SS1]